MLDRAGYDAIDAWPGTRRMSAAEFEWFAYTVTFPNPHHLDVARFRSRWLVMQQMHLAYYDTGYGGSTERSSLIDTPIAKAWRVVKRATTDGDCNGWAYEDYDPPGSGDLAPWFGGVDDRRGRKLV